MIDQILISMDVPGDDLRHVDWKVWARQDRLYVKQYEEETNLQCYLLIDRSSSMQYAGNGYSQFEYASTLAACLAYLVLKQQDAVVAITFDQTVRDVLPATNTANQLTKLMAVLDASETVDASDLSLIFSRVMEIFPRRGSASGVSEASKRFRSRLSARVWRLNFYV